MVRGQNISITDCCYTTRKRSLHFFFSSDSFLLQISVVLIFFQLTFSCSQNPTWRVHVGKLTSLVTCVDASNSTSPEVDAFCGSIAHLFPGLTPAEPPWTVAQDLRFISHILTVANFKCNVYSFLLCSKALCDTMGAHLAHKWVLPRRARQLITLGNPQTVE